MSTEPASSSRPHTPRRASRAPVIVLVGGLALAVGLVLLGARLAAVPAAAPDLSQPGTPEQPRPVNVILRDYAFNPTPLHLVAGETIRFQIVNAGLIDHEFVLGDADVHAAWALANAQATPPGLLATAPPASVPVGTGGVRVLLAPGQAASVTHVVTPAAGLQLMCHLPGHVERGMVGEVRIVADPPPAAPDT